MKTLDLTGKGALVTGSTQGIGRGMADALVEAGARVVYHGLEAAPALGDMCLAQDLMQPDAPEKLMERAFALVPEMDTLVCNAGSFFDTPFLEMTHENWDKTFHLNVRAPYFLVQAFVRRMAAAKKPGSVTLISSTNGFQAEPDSTAYDSSKGAIVMLTRSLAVDLAQHGIRVNCIAPGLVRTPLTERWLNTNTVQREHYERNIPLGRIGLPQDCGGIAVLFASDAGSYITGQIMAVDGGLTALQIGPAVSEETGRGFTGSA